MISEGGLEIALRIQKRMLAEARQKLKEARDTLKKNEEQTEELTKAVFAMKEKIASLVQDRTALIEAKDAKIKMLQQRLSNLNAEYNALSLFKMNQRADVPQKAPDTPPRGHTTLEDVYKLTGEI